MSRTEYSDRFHDHPVFVSPPKKFIVAVYMEDQAYGGPEEGGWYYTKGEIVRPVRIFGNEENAIKFCRRLNDKLHATLNKHRRPISSVLSEGRYSAQVCEDKVEDYFPAERPHYE